ncbi:MAG TPA: phosphoglucomutase (alpha-D-glucose-1,6-bisphosphate-dependent) [Bryobacteraceae bacterium]|jgi:phosphoglucomutase|nr:phosphoglucomutase (alpha-D-glucose-1,6-bisphosphate-dependent) [Bryobacteraceae bacterium]
MSISPLAGKLPPDSMLVQIPKLLNAYYAEKPDPGVLEERVSFGTSGHRGSSFKRSFNEHHILAITQAIVEYRAAQGYTGPLFMGMDTHALSRPALETALEVLAANGVHTMIAGDEVYTPTPAVSHSILNYNRGRSEGLADGILITPSHNPPEDGGFKYNPSHGGPADTDATSAIEARANELLANGLRGVQRISFDEARRSSTTHAHDFRGAYIRELGEVIDFDVLRGAGLKLGVDPLGGAGAYYWPLIADFYRLDLDVIRTEVDPTFSFMTVDWDGKIRMDPSSPYAMGALIGQRETFDIAFACDTDHDRHGIVTRSAGLMQPNHYLAVCVLYLFTHRPQWNAGSAVGKTLVSSSMIDRVTAKIGRALYEVPVGFKWFVEGLLSGALGFGGEESAGASFLRRDGGAWSTDKDGLIAALLSAEITAVMGKDPSQVYKSLTEEFGDPAYARTDAPATLAQKKILSKLSPEDIRAKELAGEPIRQILTRAPGNGKPIGGLKVTTDNAWFAARPSGTEEIYKIYAESFRGPEHLKAVQAEAQKIVSEAFANASALLSRSV